MYFAVCLASLSYTFWGDLVPPTCTRQPCAGILLVGTSASGASHSLTPRTRAPQAQCAVRILDMNTFEHRFWRLGSATRFTQGRRTQTKGAIACRDHARAAYAAWPRNNTFRAQEMDSFNRNGSDEGRDGVEHDGLAELTGIVVEDGPGLGARHRWEMVKRPAGDGHHVVHIRPAAHAAEHVSCCSHVTCGWAGSAGPVSIRAAHWL